MSDRRQRLKYPNSVIDTPKGTCRLWPPGKNDTANGSSPANRPSLPQTQRTPDLLLSCLAIAVTGSQPSPPHRPIGPFRRIVSGLDGANESR